MGATEKQWQEQAEAVETFANALAEGRVPADLRWSAVKRLKDNVDTLMAWTDRESHTGRDSVVTCKHCGYPIQRIGTSWAHQQRGADSICSLALPREA